ncbi:hypothetical protein BJ741DRAFT_662967 [Chytriomyces cf. hyalinus JEL632]|nr:hypothetical protein BJ741DRAFT_662967 [Chytriomyces cf. hyalinus JEL632]
MLPRVSISVILIATALLLHSRSIRSFGKNAVAPSKSFCVPLCNLAKPDIFLVRTNAAGVYQRCQNIKSGYSSNESWATSVLRLDTRTEIHFEPTTNFVPFWKPSLNAESLLRKANHTGTKNAHCSDASPRIDIDTSSNQTLSCRFHVSPRSIFGLLICLWPFMLIGMYELIDRLEAKWEASYMKKMVQNLSLVHWSEDTAIEMYNADMCVICISKFQKSDAIRILPW